MRVDALTIFPEYLAPLELSLIGKAREDGLIDVHVHDLRSWTTDRHHTVDDAPLGGGAGMVMKPDVWGRALEDVLAEGISHCGPGTSRTVLAIPTPSGTPLTQRMVEDLAGADRLVIACGRYEGIDARVAEHYTGRVEVLEYSIGDYVLNGGEVAALVLVEAVARLLPGVIGNPESLAEESHGEAGLLEYPVYTRPARWRGLDAPEVLLSGHHANIERWRRDRALERTSARRPDMMAALTPDKLQPGDRAALARLGWGSTPEGLRRVTIRPAEAGDAEALAALAGDTFPLACPPTVPEDAIAEFIETNLSAAKFDEYLADPARYVVLVAEIDGDPRLAGYTLSVVPRTADEPPYAADVAAVVTARPAAELSKLYMRAEYHASGIARALMDATLAELWGRSVDGEPMATIWLGTNRGNGRAQTFYKRTGFKRVGTRTFQIGGRDQNDSVWALGGLEKAEGAVAD